MRKLKEAAHYPHFTAISPDGKSVALAASATDVDLWDLGTGQHRTFRTTSPIAGLGFASHGASLRVAQHSGTVTTWNARTGRKIGSLACGSATPYPPDARMGPRPVFRADGNAMAWGSGLGTVRAWDLHTGRETPGLRLYAEGLVWVGFSPDGRSLRVAGTRGELGIWDAASGAQRLALHNAGGNRETLYTPTVDRRRLVIVNVTHRAFTPQAKPEDGRILLWDASTKRGPVAAPGAGSVRLGRRMTPGNSRIIAMEISGQIRAYDASTGKPARSFAGQKGEYHLAMSADGVRLATALGDTVHVYELATGRLVHALKGPTIAGTLAVAPDSRTLASADCRAWSAFTAGTHDLLLGSGQRASIAADHLAAYQ